MTLSVRVGTVFFPPPVFLCCATGMPGACNYDLLILAGNFPHRTFVLKAASLLDSPEWQRQKWLGKVIKRKRVAADGFLVELDGNCKGGRR